MTGKNIYEICFERRLGNFLKFHQISYEAKERYTQMNAEFQRISRRDKKAFLNEQFKEIEEKSRMGKSRDFFKKSDTIKGIFHARMGIIKERNGKDLTKAKKIKKTCKNMHNKYKKEVLVTWITTLV